MRKNYTQPRWSRHQEHMRGRSEEYDEREDDYDHHYGRGRDSGRGRGGRNRRPYYRTAAQTFRPRRYKHPPSHDSSASFREGDSRQGIRKYPTSRFEYKPKRASIDTGSKRAQGNSKDDSSAQGNSQKNKVESDASLDMGRNNYSDTDFDERAGADGGAVMWEETHEVYSDVLTRLPDVGKDMGDHDADEYISTAAKLLGLKRTERMKITSRPLDKCGVPTPPRELTNKLFRPEGFQQGNKLVSEEKKATFIVLEPVLKEAPSMMTNTLAQEFIRNPSKQWLNNSSLQLRASLPYHHKLLLWTRMMLTSEDDKAMLLQADIFRGVLASLYHVPINTSLLAAFLTFWNTEGHTLVTTQGEMGYPLIAMYDAMGIPISGHLYEEYIPVESEVSGIVQVLHTAYTDIWLLNQKGGSPSVTLQNWIDHFIGEDLGATVKTKVQMPSHFYADPEDPLLSRLEFRTIELQKHWSARFSNYKVFYQQEYGREVYRAAFIAAWLCTYCIPVDMGAFIRPEVFSAAARLAQGVRLAIGTASMAHLYQSLDNVCNHIIAESKSASECQLSIPAHFIMGWFSSYWKMTPSQPGVDPRITHFPPFVTDAWRITSADVNLSKAHRLFIDSAADQKSLLSLSFLGKSRIRFPKSESEVLLSDTRESVDGGRNTIRITTIDMLISSSVGAVTHTRCQTHNNLLYCPHRFARMHACDQDVPDFFMEGANGQFLLQFPAYLEGTREETVEHLQRRHLAYHFPSGHQFHLQPLSRRTKCSVEYIKWCISALSFLTNADVICSGQEPLCAVQTDQIKTPSSLASQGLKIKKKDSGKTALSTDPGVSTILNERAPSIPKTKKKKASKPSSMPATTLLPQEKTPVPNKKGNVVSDEKIIEASSSLGAQTVNPLVGEVSAGKRSSPKETAARFLQVQASHSLKAGGNRKKDVTTTEAHVPIPVDNELSLPAERDVPPKNRGKRASPQHAREEGDADLVKPDVEDEKLDVATEQPENHHDKSPVKKQCLSRPGDDHDLEAALSKATALKSTIDQTVKCYLESVGDEFTNLKRTSQQNIISHYGERTGIVVPPFADPGLRSLMGYIRADLERIHKWIAAPVLDKVALSARIGRILGRWGAMLQDRIPQEVQELMNELKHLSENLNSKVEHAVPFSISQLRADEEHVEEQLSVGKKSHGSIMLGYNSLKGYSSVWGSLKDEVKQRKEECLVKIKELNDALGNARARLSLEKEREEKLNQLHDQYDGILSGASEALSGFEETLAQGSSCLESIKRAIAETGSLGDSELPIGLREQLKFVESCVIEGVEENDE